MYRQLKECASEKMLQEESCLALLKQVNGAVKIFSLSERNETTLALDRATGLVEDLYPFKNYLSGTEKEVNYFVLLQNNFELRANGGFVGSYAVITARDGKFGIRFEDIYTPDGQLIGYVEPPQPIQKAFKKGGLYLRDADFEPDFPSSARALSWFFEKGNEATPDMMITLSFATVKEIVELVGEVEVSEYNLALNKENIYAFLQGESEVGFFPGSTQKKDAIAATGKAVLRKLSSLSITEKARLFNLVFDDLQKKNVVVYSSNEALENMFLSSGFGGEWKGMDCIEEGCVGDKFGIVEMNLGANKANCCVKRQTDHSIHFTDGVIRHKVSVWFENQSEMENPNPPLFYGGNYISYLRFYLPKEAINLKVSTSEEIRNVEKYGFREIGFFHTTKAKERSILELEYEIPALEQKGYQLNILKQNGVVESPQSIDLFGRKITTDLNDDFVVIEEIK